MARGMKAKSVKSKAKQQPLASAKKAAPVAKAASKKAELRLVKTDSANAKIQKSLTKKGEIADAPRAKSSEGEKKVSQKLIETIERRKREREGGSPSPFNRPMGRRGRRPKHPVDYVPTNGEGESNGETQETSYVLENEYEHLEYDTGIKMKEGGDDKGFALDRFEDFDEELNFDW